MCKPGIARQPAVFGRYVISSIGIAIDQAHAYVHSTMQLVHYVCISTQLQLLKAIRWAITWPAGVAANACGKSSVGLIETELHALLCMLQMNLHELLYEWRCPNSNSTGFQAVV